MPFELRSSGNLRPQSLSWRALKESKGWASEWKHLNQIYYINQKYEQKNIIFVYDDYSNID